MKNEAAIHERKIRKWTEEKAAKRAGISRQTLRDIEDGHIPNLKTAYRLADAYGCSVYDIFLPEFVEKVDNRRKKEVS